MKKKSTLIYLHGFNSSALSEKAQIVGEYIQKNKLNCDLSIPELSEEPEITAQHLITLATPLMKKGPIYIIGSSLGGFYGTWLMEQLLATKTNPQTNSQTNSQTKHCIKLALINPAVAPWLLIDRYLGEHINTYTGQTVKVTPRHGAQLRQLQIETLSHPDNILVLLQTGDETLDYKEALSFYNDCPTHIEKGGHHEFEGFDSILPTILQFFNPRLAIFD